jgi:hypothetical protein
MARHTSLGPKRMVRVVGHEATTLIISVQVASHDPPLRDLKTIDLDSLSPKMNCLLGQEMVLSVAGQMPPRQTLACFDDGRAPVVLVGAVTGEFVPGEAAMVDELLFSLPKIPPTIPPTTATTTIVKTTATVIHHRVDFRFPCFTSCWSIGWGTLYSTTGS